MNASSQSAPSDQMIRTPAADLVHHPAVAEVLAGKRYVSYPYVVSVLVISFQRNMGKARLVETGQWPMAPLFAATALTLLFGWWGLPMGLIRSPLALIDHWKGGHDFTREVLTVIVGAPEAKRILRVAPKPKVPPTVWLVRLLILMPVILSTAWLLNSIYPAVAP